MSVRRAIKRSKMLTLYHFTPPGNLNAILDDDPMLPQSTMAIWLTSDPNGNRIIDECMSFYRRKGMSDLIAEVEFFLRNIPQMHHRSRPGW
jgi:hypothetical protein